MTMFENSVERITKDVQSLAASAEKKIQELQDHIAQMSDSHSVLQKLKEYPCRPSVEFVSIDGWRNRSNFGHNYRNNDTVKKMPEKAMDDYIKLLKEWYQQVTDIFAENQKICESNKNLMNKLIQILKNAGYPEKEYVYRNSRKIKGDWKQSEWITQIVVQTPERNSYPSGFKFGGYEYDEDYIIIEKELKERALKKQKEEQEKAEKEQKEKHDAALYNMKMKYQCPFEKDILDHILEQNKYLYLAYHLWRNRGDWSDGCDWAKMGLDGFKVETVEDQEIVDEIQSYFENFSDGRIFRDCHYNYHWLFAKVEKEYPELYQDYLFLDKKEF